MNNNLLLATLLARSYHSDAVVEKIDNLASQDIDWNELTGLIQHHRISGLCLETFRKLNHPSIPTELIHTLQAECTQSTRNALVLMNALHKLIELIQSQGIEVACFKGVVAAQLIYGQLSMRNFSDIDLFVRPADHAATEHLLIENGFRITNRYDDAYQSSLRDDQRRVNVDLHWGVPPQELNLTAHLLWDNISTIDIGNQAIPTFSFADTLLLTAVNAIKEYWDSHLYRFCDLAELIHRHPQPDWNAIFRRAEQLGCQRTLFAALIVSEKLLGAPIPRDVTNMLSNHHELDPIVDELIKQLEQSHLNSGDDSYRKPKVVSSHKHYFLLLQDTLGRKLQFWLQWALTPGAADRELISLPRRLSGLYYLVRPIRLLLQRNHQERNVRL